jgi:hypothetical protein
MGHLRSKETQEGKEINEETREVDEEHDIKSCPSEDGQDLDDEIQEAEEEQEMEQWEKDEMEGRELASREMVLRPGQKTTLVSLLRALYQWCLETFPAATAIVTSLPVTIVPFALSMSVLVQALVTKGWVLELAYGWDHYVQKTGTVGAIGGMSFISVILCNVSFNFPHC